MRFRRYAMKLKDIGEIEFEKAYFVNGETKLFYEPQYKADILILMNIFPVFRNLEISMRGRKGNDIILEVLGVGKS